MIQLNFIRLKNISILLILFLWNCSGSKDLKSKENIISIIIDDYILEFSEINGRKPNAILIWEEGKSVITIADLSQNVSMGYLRKSMRNEDNLSAGKFSNVLCIYYNDAIGADKIIFKDVPLKLQKKALQSINSITINGTEILLPYELAEWEPSLEIKYNLNTQKKIIDDYMKRTERTVDFSPCSTQAKSTS